MLGLAGTDTYLKREADLAKLASRLQAAGGRPETTDQHPLSKVYLLEDCRKDSCGGFKTSFFLKL